MCGINGFVQYKSIYKKDKLSNIVHNMNEAIIHRGPDSEGLYADENCAIGMRRLSIIDLQGGSQPIWNENGNLAIVFNGELYNYQSLRKKLIEKGHIFSTMSDTEVVLHGYEEYGTDFLKSMEGMFAFAIYNKQDNKFIIARDRIGEKPLYYYKGDEFFVFGSELKSLLTTQLIEKKINREALSYYFQLTYIPAPMCIIDGVYKLPAASYMELGQDGTFIIKPYWELHYDTNSLITDYDYAKKQLREILFQSVEQRMISDVPLGAFLSGGIDSTTIVGIMSEISSTPVDTFTIGFKEKQYDESELAQLAANRHNTHHHVLTLDWNEAVLELDHILDNVDEPFADQSLIATYMVSKMTKQYVTVALTGDAGDELFAGYNKYLIGYYSDKFNRFPGIVRYGIKGVSRILPNRSTAARKINKVLSVVDKDIFEQRKTMMSLGFKKGEVQQLMRSGYGSNMGLLREFYDKLDSADEQTRTQFLDLNVVLEGCMLPKVDRASMLASLETRVPMLDSKLIEFTYRLPSSFKINGKNRKIILKDTFSDLIPEKLLTAPKKGFSVPIADWLEDDLENQLYKFADRDFLENQGLFNYEYIKTMIDAHMNHKGNFYGQIWAFYVFQHWYMNYIDREYGGI